MHDIQKEAIAEVEARAGVRHPNPTMGPRDKAPEEAFDRYGNVCHPDSVAAVRSGGVDMAQLNSPSRSDVAATLAERGGSHGRFEDNGEIMQALKRTMREFSRKRHPSESEDGAIIRLKPYEAILTPEQREALDMIAHKIGRILSGDPNFRDHWHDIAGYATLIRDKCAK